MKLVFYLLVLEASLQQGFARQVYRRHDGAPNSGGLADLDAVNAALQRERVIPDGEDKTFEERKPSTHDAVDVKLCVSDPQCGAESPPQHQLSSWLRPIGEQVSIPHLQRIPERRSTCLQNSVSPAIRPQMKRNRPHARAQPNIP